MVHFLVLVIGYLICGGKMAVVRPHVWSSYVNSVLFRFLCSLLFKVKLVWIDCSSVSRCRTVLSDPSRDHLKWKWNASIFILETNGLIIVCISDCLFNKEIMKCFSGRIFMSRSVLLTISQSAVCVLLVVAARFCCSVVLLRCSGWRVRFLVFLYLLNLK